LPDENEISFQISGKKIPFVRLESKPSGQYVFFPVTNDGLHYSVHPVGNPHLRNKFGQLAELDLEDLKRTTVEDFQTLFRYPRYSRDLFVLPIPSSFGAWFGDMFDMPGFFSKFFQGKTIYVMRARRLPEFFQAKPDTYVIIDPKGNNKVMMQFKGNPLGPLNFDANKGPSNPRMKNMFSINLGIQKALSELHDSQLDVELDELTVSQMGAQVKAILEQVQIIRWNKGGRERSLGPMVDYFRARRLSFA
jgi:hypothetical protein